MRTGPPVQGQGPEYFGPNLKGRVEGQKLL
jgi:hypothetical protein